jgi:hypothetical protein
VTAQIVAAGLAGEDRDDLAAEFAPTRFAGVPVTA